MITSLIYLVIYLIVIGIVVWLLIYLIDNVPLPEPFNRVARVIIMVVGVLIVILLLLQFVGAIDGGMPRLGR
jgi:cytochrome c biogenesis protein CcdA